MNEQAQNQSDLIVEYLRDRAAPCPMCGYDLKCQTSARCPECGSELELQLKPTKPRMGAWITGLVGLSAGLGFNGVFGALLIFMETTDSIFEAWSIPAGTVTCGSLIWIWVRQSVRLRRLTLSARWLLAALCWGITVGSVLLFVWLIT